MPEMPCLSCTHLTLWTGSHVALQVHSSRQEEEVERGTKNVPQDGNPKYGNLHVRDVCPACALRVQVPQAPVQDEDI